MGWRPIDFQGIMTLQVALVKQLEHYLNEKETVLADRLLSAIQPAKVALPSVPQTGLKLSDAVESFNKRSRLLDQTKQDQPSLEQRVKVVKEVNEALWKYVEVLEGCITELFQQLKLGGIDQWHSALSQTVEGLKELLLHRIEDLCWAIRWLKPSLRQYHQDFFFWRNPLDSRLLANLASSEKFLKSRYQSFIKLYDKYTELTTKAKSLYAKQERYVVFTSLEKDERSLYEQMLRWLTLRDLDAHDDRSLVSYITVALKNAVGIDQARTLFKSYYRRLDNTLYSVSKELKKVPLEPHENTEVKQSLKERTTLLMEEVQSLMDLIVSYREFLLKTDPNPYIRSRLGFTEWIVGPEPLKTRSLMQLVYDTKELYNRFNMISLSLEGVAPTSLGTVYEEIERLLHEMSSPLISKEMMRRKGDQLLHDVDQCDMLGSLSFEVVAYVGTVLDRSMRVDWKYHVLHENSLFHAIVEEYSGLFDSDSDVVHDGRVEKLKDLFTHIEEWVEKGDVDAHINDIAIDINDMKTYLQDFLATVQRLLKDQSLTETLRDHAIQQLSYQLLEYRYYFGDFIMHLIHAEGSGGAHLRNRFLFVDQYFETIDMLLNE